MTASPYTHPVEAGRGVIVVESTSRIADVHSYAGMAYLVNQSGQNDSPGLTSVLIDVQAETTVEAQVDIATRREYLSVAVKYQRTMLWYVEVDDR